MNWLRNYYFTRAAASAAWVGLMAGLGHALPQSVGPLLVAYPAWDALANWIDAKSNGGLAQNKTQALNAGISAAIAIAVGVAVGSGANAALAVFGAWAILAGLLQLATGLRRWKILGAQWAMVLSGGQSALAGAFFIKQASGTETADLTALVGYAGFGAFYFLVSALWLQFRQRR